MRTKQSRAAVVALTVAGLLAAGTMAYADDDVENRTTVTGGDGGYALSGGNTVGTNGATSGDATATGGDGGSANNYQNAGDGEGEYGPNCVTGSSFTFGLLAAVQGVNVCPNVGPVASSFEGGDANGGSARSGSVSQTNNASSTAEANGGSAGIGSEKATKHKSKKAKKKHRRRH
jgi:hypothetical protein